MKRLIVLIITIGLIVVGCSQAETSGNSTKDRVYSNLWDGNPIVVEQRNNANSMMVNEITDSVEVQKLIEAMKNADWRENVKVDIRPPDYTFNWNSYMHSVWVNEEYEKLELMIDGQSNFGTLSKPSSEIVFEILTGKRF